MNKVLLDLGIFQIKWYSFFIFLAILTATILIFKEAKKKNIDEDYLVNLIFYGVIIGVLGARAYYVLFNLDYYLANPSEIIMIWNGGLAIHGGIISTLIFLLIYSKKKNKNILLILDIIVVGLIIAQAIGRWGNFFNSEAYGRVTSLSNLQNLHLPKFIINGMYINGNYREPTFLYESVASFIGFIIMLVIRKLKSLRLGQLTGFYLVWYGVARFIIERLRSDSLLLGSLKVAQIVSLIEIIIGLYFIFINKKKEKLYNEVKEHNN
jgi:phosphatidylglycerol:prolipoprotein diacylglycerol transferase